MKFELAAKRNPSKGKIIFCAVKCIIGIFLRFIKTVKKKEKKRGRHESISYLLGLLEPVCVCEDLDIDADSESQWCTRTAK